MGEWLCMCQLVSHAIITNQSSIITMQSSPCNHHTITHHNHIHLQEHTNSHTADPTTSQPAPAAISNRHQQLHADSSTNTE